MRDEILALGQRVNKLEDFKMCLNKSSDASVSKRDRDKYMKQIRLEHSSFDQAFVNLGLKKKLTADEQVELNDEHVRQRHAHLLQT